MTDLAARVNTSVQNTGFEQAAAPVQLGFGELYPDLVQTGKMADSVVLSEGISLVNPSEPVTKEVRKPMTTIPYAPYGAPRPVEIEFFSDKEYRPVVIDDGPVAMRPHKHVISPKLLQLLEI